MSESPVAAACRRVLAIEASPGALLLDDVDSSSARVVIENEDGYHIVADGLTRELAQLLQLAPTLRDLLCGEGGFAEMVLKLEWHDTHPTGSPQCPLCRMCEREGHRKDCDLGKLMRRAAEELGA